MATQPLATGRVFTLALNGHTVDEIQFDLGGPCGDLHNGRARALNGHDGEYMRTSAARKGIAAFNWRSWTGLSCEEVSVIEEKLAASIPPGLLLENIRFSGIPNFSQLLPTSRLVFPERTIDGATSQAMLAVWEENEPCSHVGARIAEHHENPSLRKQFIPAAHGKRGVMGFVLIAGLVAVGDEVLVYPPNDYKLRG